MKKEGRKFGKKTREGIFAGYKDSCRPSTAERGRRLSRRGVAAACPASGLAGRRARLKRSSQESPLEPPQTTLELCRGVSSLHAHLPAAPRRLRCKSSTRNEVLARNLRGGGSASILFPQAGHENSMARSAVEWQASSRSRSEATPDRTRAEHALATKTRCAALLNGRPSFCTPSVVNRRRAKGKAASHRPRRSATYVSANLFADSSSRNSKRPCTRHSPSASAASRRAPWHRQRSSAGAADP